LAFFGFGLTARAEGPPVHLDLSKCARLDAASVRRIFAADLGTKADAPPGEDVTAVIIRCDGSKVVMTVRDPLSRKAVRRTFDSTTFGERGEARLVALAASELVFASWSELDTNPAPAVTGEGPPARAETLATARAVVRARDMARAQPGSERRANANATAGKLVPRTLDGTPVKSPVAGRGEARAAAPADADDFDDADLTLEEQPLSDNGAGPHPVVRRAVAVISRRTFLDVRGGLTGGGARYGEDREGLVSWSTDALVEKGSVQTFQVTSWSAGACLFAHRRAGISTVRLGAGLRGGVLQVDAGPNVVTWGWPLGVLSLSVRGGPVFVDLTGEIGYGVLPVRGGANPAIWTAWVNGQVGLGLAL
jgi:hypothetical protein